MAFEMFAGPNREEIGYQEESLLSLAAEDAMRYPELSSIWGAFYKSPRLSARQAGELVHELIALLAANGGSTNKALASTVVRLLLFFSAAYRNGQEIRCSSD